MASTVALHSSCAWEVELGPQGRGIAMTKDPLLCMLSRQLPSLRQVRLWPLPRSKRPEWAASCLVQVDMQQLQGLEGSEAQRMSMEISWCGRRTQPPLTLPSPQGTICPWHRVTWTPPEPPNRSPMPASSSPRGPASFRSGAVQG